MKIRRAVRYLFGICGIALFIHLIGSVGLAKILDSIQEIGWWALAIIAIGGGVLLVRSLAWRCTLGREYRHMPVSTLFRIYAAAESIGFLFLGGPAVGDTTRVLMLRGTIPTVRVIAAVALDRGLYLVGSAILLAVTMFLLPLVLHGGSKIPTSIYGIGSVFVLIFFTLWVAMRKRVRLLSGLLFLASKLRPLRGWTERRSAGVVEVERTMFHFLDTDRPRFWSAFALNLVAHGLAVIEVLLVLWLLGAGGSVTNALFIEGMTKIAGISGAVIPGNVGAYEAANMLILKLLSLKPAMGLILALVRDVRRIFWLGAGLALFFYSGFRHIPVSAEYQRGTEA